ncbi:hypothetical protein JCM10213_003074 [Rhodosporidiobolus nylandii]
MHRLDKAVSDKAAPLLRVRHVHEDVDRLLESPGKEGELVKALGQLETTFESAFAGDEKEAIEENLAQLQSAVFARYREKHSHLSLGDTEAAFARLLKEGSR